MQCWRCKANGHTNGGYGHRTGDRECPFFLSGNIASEELRKSIEDPMAGQLTNSADGDGDGKPLRTFGSAEEVLGVLEQIKALEKMKKKKRKKRKKEKSSKKGKKGKKETKGKKRRKTSVSSSDSDSAGKGGGPDNPVVRIEVEQFGTMEVRIYLDKVPLTASNFLGEFWAVQCSLERSRTVRRWSELL